MCLEVADALFEIAKVVDAGLEIVVSETIVICRETTTLTCKMANLCISCP